MTRDEPFYIEYTEKEKMEYIYFYQVQKDRINKYTQQGIIRADNPIGDLLALFYFEVTDNHPLVIRNDVYNKFKTKISILQKEIEYNLSIVELLHDYFRYTKISLNKESEFLAKEWSDDNE